MKKRIKESYCENEMMKKTTEGVYCGPEHHFFSLCRRPKWKPNLKDEDWLWGADDCNFRSKFLIVFIKKLNCLRTKMSELFWYCRLLRKVKSLQRKKLKSSWVSYMIIFTYSLIICNICSICLLIISRLTKIFDFYDFIVYQPKPFGKMTFAMSPTLHGFLKLIDSIDTYANVLIPKVMGIIN